MEQDAIHTTPKRASTPSNSPSPLPVSADRDPGERPGILIADDQAPVRNLLDTALRGRGFQVWLAEDGVETLELYCRHRQAICLALIDVDMPRFDGLQTLAALHALNPDLPCYLMTGGSHPVEELLASGPLAIFSKPFRIMEMADALWRSAIHYHGFVTK